MTDFYGDLECTTHSFACPCREQQFRQMEAENAQLREIVEHTPIRLRNGWVTVRRTAPGWLVEDLARALYLQPDGEWDQMPGWFPDVLSAYQAAKKALRLIRLLEVSDGRE